MATLFAPKPQLAPSIRLVLAMFQLYADIETSFGKAVLDILKKQYPDQVIDISPSTVGHKMMAIARKQNQNNDSRSMDAIQDFLTYISVGSKQVKDEKGNVIDRKTANPWNFAKNFATWKDALSAIYTNLRRRSMDRSIQNSKQKKKERSVDDAFGKRGEGGGAPEGGEAFMPTTDETGLGKALDDKAASKEFIDLIDDYLPELQSKLPYEQAALLELIMKDDVGGFGSDIQDNMGQATGFKEKLEKAAAEGNQDAVNILKKNEKRWSGFVGDTRKKLLQSIENFVEKHMTPGDYEALYDQFFSDTTPGAVDKLEKSKNDAKFDYQLGLDKRKYAREKYKMLNGLLDDKGKKSFENLEKKLKGLGIDTDSIEPVKDDKKTKEAPADQIQQVASRLASFW